jgi:proline iminopeptidase
MKKFKENLMLSYFFSFPKKNNQIISLFIVLCLIIFGCEPQNISETEEGTIEINGCDIYYKRMGGGIPTFILHGGPGDGYDTMLPLNKLKDQFKLIFYDQRAAARSTGDADTASHTIENFVEDLEQLRLKLAPEKINVIGGSWGAMLAMQYALKYSHNINSMVLMASMAPNSNLLKTFFANRNNRQTTEDSLTLEKISSTEEFKNNNPETIEKFWRVFFRAYCYNPTYADSINLFIRDTSYQKVPGRYFKLWKFFQNYDIQEDLKNISCPTLVVHGKHDPMPLEGSKLIHENIPGSQFAIIRNAGHWLWVEAPDQLFPIIRKFLIKH